MYLRVCMHACAYMGVWLQMHVYMPCAYMGVWLQMHMSFWAEVEDNLQELVLNFTF